MLPSMSARFCALKIRSWVLRYSNCCPARRGMCCWPMSAGPWQAAQTFGSAALASAAQKRSAAVAAAARGVPNLKTLLLVRDPVDDPVVVVRDQHRAVFQHYQVDRPAPHRRVGLLVGEEAG